MNLEDTVIEVIIQGPQGPAGNAPYDGIRNGVVDTSPTENAVFDALVTKAELEHTHTWDEVLDIPATFPPSTHNHIISEVVGLQDTLDDKANVEHSHNVTDIDGFLGILETKAPVVHEHSIGEVVNLQNTLNSKAPVVHTHSVSDVDGLSESLSNLQETKAPVVHGHSIGDVSNLQNTLNSKAPVVHTHIVSDVDGLQEDLNNLQNNINTKAPLVHTHTIGQVVNLQNTLNTKSDVGHGHDISDISELQDNLDSKASVVHTHTFSEVAGVAPIVHSHFISEVSGLQPALDSKSDVGHLHTPDEIGAIATDGSSIVTGPIVFNEDSEVKLQLNQDSSIATGSGKLTIINDTGPVIIETASPKVKQGGVEYEIYHENHIPTPAEVGAVNLTGDEMTGALKALNFQARDIVNNMQGIRIGGGADYAEVIPVDTLGSVLWTESLRYYPNTGKWTSQAPQGTSPESLARKDYVDSEISAAATNLDNLKVNRAGDEMIGGLKALNFQARDIAQSMRGIWIGGGADYSEVVPVDTLGSILWTESIRYFPNADKWTLQSSQGTAVNSITRKDYVDTGLASKLNLSGGVLTGPLTLSADGDSGSAQAATVRQIPTRKKIEVRWTGLTAVLVNGVSTNIIALLKAITPASGTIGPFLNTTSDKLNVYNDDASVGIKINITGSFKGNNIDRSMHLDFLGTNGNRVVVNRNQGGVVPPDIMQFRTFLSIDKNGNIATNGTAMEIVAAGSDYTISEVVIIVEQVTALTTITPV